MRQLLAIPILICGLALAAGCGNTAGPSVPAANGGASASPAAASGGYSAFFGCLRQHGISVPDPPSSPGTVGQWVDQQSAQNPHFDPAAVACQSQLPASDPNSHPANQAPSAQLLEQLRTFAVCMRAHGIQMSDPTPTGDMWVGGRLAHVSRAQVNNDPGWKAAIAACKSKLPGRLGSKFGKGISP